MQAGRDARILCALLAVGALLRGLYLAEIVDAPDFTAPQVDGGYHDTWARALLSGNWAPPPHQHDPLIQTTPYFRPPGYPYFLAFVYWLTDSSYLGIRIVQMTLGLGSALVAFLFAKHWFTSRVGLLFAGTMSVYWGFIYFEGDLVEPALVSFLALLLIWDLSLWTRSTSFARSMRTGLLFGLSLLVRPNILLFLPFALFWAFWVLKDKPRFIRLALGLVLATCLTISPATIRNWAVAGDFVPISSNAGVNLLLGNHPEANGTISPNLPGLGEFSTCYDYPKLVSAVEAKVGKPLKHSEVSAYLAGQAKDYILTHPLEALKLTGRKALLFWGPSEVGNSKEDAIEREHSAVLSRIPGNFSLVVALFLLGLWTLISERKREVPKRWQVGLLVALFIAAYFVSYLPYFAAGRFRMPLVPFLLFLGAIGLDRTIQLAQDRRRNALLLRVLGGLAAYALFSLNLAGHEPNPDKWHFDRGVSLVGLGRIDEAIQEYRAALAIRPKNAPALFNLGSALQSKEETEQALALYRQALAVDPQHSWSNQALGRVLAERGELEPAVRHYQLALKSAESPNLYVEYADLLLKQEKDTEAELAYRSAIRLDPGYLPAHNNLAILLFLTGDYAGAWNQVLLCRKYGGSPPPEFLEALAQKLPEPGG